MSFLDNFDGASLDARWTTNSATFDVANDNVDMSTGSLGTSAGLLSEADYNNLDVSFTFTMDTLYNSMFIFLTKSAQTNNIGARLQVNRQSAGGGTDSCNLAFSTQQYGSYGAVTGSSSTVDFSDPDNIVRIQRNGTGQWTVTANGTVVIDGVQEPVEVTNEVSAMDAGLVFGNSIGGCTLSSVSHTSAGAGNVTPVAPDDTFSIIEDASNNDVIGTYTATDSDGTIASYSISGSVLGIDNAGVLTLLDNTGITAGTPITATVTATDNDGATDTALITVNVTAVAVNAGIRFDCFDADDSNAAIVSETLPRVRLFSSDGSTEIANLTNVAINASGVAEIDSETVGALSDTGIAMAWRTNGDVTEGFQYTVIDLDA